MNVIYNLMTNEFVQFLVRIRHRRRHYHHSSGRNMSLPGLLVFLAGAILIYITFRTTLIEKIISNELIRTILKIIITLIGISFIISSFVLDTHSN